jgi:hypothetical protein
LHAQLKLEIFNAQERFRYAYAKHALNGISVDKTLKEAMVKILNN